MSSIVLISDNGLFILPTLSKVNFASRNIQIFNHIFCKYLWFYEIPQYHIYHCLLFMLEILKKALDNGICTGIVLTD